MAYKTKKESKYASGRGPLKHQIAYWEKNRPTYDIAPEAGEVVEMAQREAFGTPQEIVSARTALDVGVAETMAQAGKMSDSGSGMLATLEAISAQKSGAYLDLAGKEASIRSQRLGDLYRSKYAMIEEKDKAFEYNVAAPYADKVTGLRARKTQRAENWMRLAEGTISAAGSALSGGL